MHMTAKIDAMNAIALHYQRFAREEAAGRSAVYETLTRSLVIRDSDEIFELKNSARTRDSFMASGNRSSSPVLGAPAVTA